MVEIVISGQRDLDETRRKLDLATLRIEHLELESRSELRFRALLERSAEAVALSSADGITLYMSPAAERILGRPAGELVGTNVFAWIYEPDLPGAMTAMRTLLAEPSRHVSAEFRVRLPDGSLRWLEAIGANLLGDPEVAALVSNFRDITRRVAAEREAAAALVEADLGRRKLEAILAALPVGVWITDATGCVTQTNPAAQRIWGGRAPHAKTASEYGVYRGSWPASGIRVRPEEWALARTLATGETILAEAIDIERFDGTSGHVLNSAAPIRDDQGHVVGSVAVTLDVTDAHDAARERERLIASLEFERRRLGTLLEKAPAFIAVMRGKTHVFELVNEAFYEFAGNRDLIGRPVLEALPELSDQGLVEIVDRVLETGEPLVVKGLPVMIRRSGDQPEQRYVNVMYQPLVEADGTRTGVFVHGVDVTDEAVTQLRMRAQFQGIPVPTYVWQRVDRDGAKQFALVDFNVAAITMSRGRIANHLGEAARDYFHDDARVLEELERCFHLGTTIQREFDRKVRTTGEVRRLVVTYAPAPPDLVLTHTEDVTERRRLEEHLRQAQKMEAVGRLAGGVAHDFNNILSVILSYTEMCLEDLAADDPVRADLREVHKAGERAVGLTRQLLAFSRQQMLQPRVIDLNEILRGLETMLRRLLGEDVELSLVTASGLREVCADPGQIEQVIMNLVVNARDAMPTGGKLTIETANIDLDDGFASGHFDTKPGPYVMLAVADTGTGMDEATRAQIFEPFFTTKEVGKGTGLGLSTVFGIVHQSDGNLWVDSEPGRGTTFKIYLPRATHLAATPALATLIGPPVGGSETILLVEDDEAVRVLARTILRRHGYKVLDAQSADEALRTCEQFPAAIHLLVTDVVMPRMSGRQLAELVVHRRHRLKVLYMSGYTDDAILHHGVLESAVALLHKPITSETLLRKVREVLDGVASVSPP